MTALARRALVTSLAGLPLAAILADPRLAALAAETLETVSVTTPGGRKVEAALAVPAKIPAPAVLLVHEWWGLNDQIKAMTREFAKEGFLALAVDLYEGKVASIKEFGAFIEISPGRDGLCHISELDVGYVGRVEDVVRIGDKVTVKVIAIDDQDRVKLSRKALLRDQAKGKEGASAGKDGGGNR